MGKPFFFTFFVDNFLLCAIVHATKNASFFGVYGMRQNKIARHRMEIDYGNNKESYDKRDGEGD